MDVPAAIRLYASSAEGSGDRREPVLEAGVDLWSTLLSIDIVQASLTMFSLNRNVNLLTV